MHSPFSEHAALANGRAGMCIAVNGGNIKVMAGKGMKTGIAQPEK